MPEELLLSLILLASPVTFVLRRLIRKQDETTTRLTRQLDAVYDAMHRQQQLLDQVLKTRAAATHQDIAVPPVSSADPNPAAAPESTAKDSAARRPAMNGPAGIAMLPMVRRADLVRGLFRGTEDAAGARQQSPATAAAVQSEVMHPAAVPANRPPRAPAAPREPNRFEAAAKDLLKRLWNWIIVGEEHIPKGVSVGFAIASQWLLRIGIVLLVVGIGFFLKYSIDHRLLNETSRVLLSVAAGLVMLIAGTRLPGNPILPGVIVGMLVAGLGWGLYQASRRIDTSAGE